MSYQVQRWKRRQRQGRQAKLWLLAFLLLLINVLASVALYQATTGERPLKPAVDRAIELKTRFEEWRDAPTHTPS